MTQLFFICFTTALLSLIFLVFIFATAEKEVSFSFILEEKDTSFFLFSFFMLTTFSLFFFAITYYMEMKAVNI